MLRLAVKLDWGKIRYRRSGLFTEEKKKQETTHKRYISHYIISTELEHSNDHWQRSSIERKETWKILKYVRAPTKDEIPYGH
jgi:hypothetical protein